MVGQLCFTKQIETKELLDPKSVWVGTTGDAMELDNITKEVQYLSNEFNSYLDITPYTNRKSTPTNVFTGKIPLHNIKLDDFVKFLFLLMNVSETIIMERYNHYKALN